MKYLTILILSISLTACGGGGDTKPSMSVRTGMISTQIRSMFGDPTSISVTTCGIKTINPWPCTIWIYGGTWYGNSATFYFADNGIGGLYLKDYDVVW